MTGTIFMETLRRHWRGMTYWGIGLGLLALTQIVIVPNVDVLQQYAEIMETMPPFLVQALGADDMAYLATPEGYLSISFLNLMLIVMAAYAVTAGLNVTTNEEDRGILDVVLSLPLARWRLVLERLLAFALLIVGIVVLMLAGIWIGLALTPALAIDPLKLVNTSLALLPGAWLVLAFTTLVAALARRKGTAMAIAGITVAASYAVDFIGRAARETIVYELRALSFFRYYDAGDTMRLGINWANFALLLVLALGLAAASLWAFERRDVGV